MGQDIKHLMRKFGMAKLSAQRSHKILMTSVGQSEREEHGVNGKDKKMEIQKGSPRQMIQDIEVSKLRNEAKHQDERARRLNDRASNVHKEIMLLSPSAEKDENRGDALRDGYTRKIRIAQYYAEKIKALNAQ